MLFAALALIVGQVPPPDDTTTTEPPREVIVRDSDYDRARIRTGFSLNGGWTFGPSQGPIGAVSVRLGIQTGRYFGVYVQSMPQLYGLLNPTSTVTAGFALHNSALAAFTILDMLELSVGPSADFVSAAVLSRENVSSGSGWGFGVHGRAALHLGQRNPTGGNRSGLSLALDLHPVFIGNVTLFMSTIGVGIDWY